MQNVTVFQLFHGIYLFEATSQIASELKKKNFIKPLNKFNSHSKGSINEFNYTQNLRITHMRPQFDAQLSSPN